jgi:predicted amidophosphoribosyltransferase
MFADADAVVPVPLHWRRLWTRRFNQAALLAEAMASSCGLPVWHAALRRVRATAQQVGLAKKERAKRHSASRKRARR